MKGLGFGFHAAFQPLCVPVDLPDGVASMMQQHVLNGAQRQADATMMHMDHARTSYLLASSVSQSLGGRMIEEAGSGRARDLALNPPTAAAPK